MGPDDNDEPRDDEEPSGEPNEPGSPSEPDAPDECKCSSGPTEVVQGECPANQPTTGGTAKGNECYFPFWFNGKKVPDLSSFVQ